MRWLKEEQGLDVSTLQDDTKLFSSGLLDSLAMVDLIAFIEDQAGVRVRWTEVSLEHLDSVGAVLGYVASKR